MAFVTTFSLPQRSRTAVAVCSSPIMAVGQPVGRRAALQLAAVGIGLGVVRAAEAKFNIEEMQYEDEVVEVGPDPLEKNITRTKKKVVEPGFRKVKKELLATNGKKFDDMLSKEKDESADLRAKFSKK